MIDFFRSLFGSSNTEKMKLIIGLGNPGKKYEITRHNIGFLALDELRVRNGCTDFKLESKFKAQIAEGNIGGEKVLLVKPTTYMNLSGESARALKKFYKLEVEDVLIVYDDKDMEFGKLRYREEGSAGGHNGIKSLISNLGGQKFPRLKIGVGDKSNPAYKDASSFVLGKFTSKEMEVIKDDLLFDICEKIEDWIAE